MIKRLLLSLLLIASPAQAVTVFGTSKSKVKRLRSTLESIKADYDTALARVAYLEKELAAAQENNRTTTTLTAELKKATDSINSYQLELAQLKHDLDWARRELARNEIMHAAHLHDNQIKDVDLAKFQEQVNRLEEATKRLEDLQSEIDEMASLPEQVFGVQETPKRVERWIESKTI